MNLSPEAISAYRLHIAQGIEELHRKWVPHAAQVEIGRALLSDGFLDVFAQCGRNFGKTELVGYLTWRYAFTFPKSENYYFAPYMKQAREIMWASRRIQDFGPKGWIESVNNTEMRITFKNGSFIKLDGSDNVDAYRGVKPKGLSIYDEFKDFRPEFHEAYDPNRAAFNSPLLIIGTPPEFEGQFTKIAEEWGNNPKKAYFTFPSSSNPHISRKWLSEKKAELITLGEEDKWFREYEAKFVRGGAKRVFPMLSPDKIVKPYGQIIQEIYRDRKKLEWFAWADPAGASCFAVLYAAINPYTRKVYLLDEIYETSQGEMTVTKIGNRILKTTREIFGDMGESEWRMGYDEAEAWFANEMLDQFDIHFEPTQKSKNEKDKGITLIKDILLADKLVVSDRCKKLVWEMDNYQKDDNGKFVKKNDHLIDCLRYILGASYYSMNESEEINPEKDEMWRGARIQDDFPSLRESKERLDEWESMPDFQW